MGLAMDLIRAYKSIQKKRAPKTVEEWTGWWLLNRCIHKVPADKLLIPKFMKDEIDTLILRVEEEYESDGAKIVVCEL